MFFITRYYRPSSYLLHTNTIYSFLCKNSHSLNCNRAFRPISETIKNEALRVVDLITHKPNLVTSDSTHSQIIRHLLHQPIIAKKAPSSSHDSFAFEAEKIDAVDLSLALTSCGSARDLRSGVGFHCAAIARGFDANVYVGTSLVSLYGKCGELRKAREVFDEMPVRNVVTWTALITVFAAESHVEACLDLFIQMRRTVSDLTLPNGFTFSALLRACHCAGALFHGRAIHSLTVRSGLLRETLVSNALVSMYSKSGALDEAKLVFEDIEEKDAVSWNSMISGYALHGLAGRAITLFEQMGRTRKPDSVTYLSLLSSCRHAGLIGEAHRHLALMAENGVFPELEHYSIMVDIFGRAGLTKEAQRVAAQMPVRPNSVVWGSVLSSSRAQGNVGFAAKAAEEGLAVEPGCAGTYVQLASLYAAKGLWGPAAETRKAMRDRGIKVASGIGCSWIEIRSVVQRFRAEDMSNPRMTDMVSILEGLRVHMRINRRSLYYDMEILD